MKPDDYIKAARVPESLKPQTFGSWRIERNFVAEMRKTMEDVTKRACLSFWGQYQLQRSIERIGFDSYTLLRRHSWATIHLENSPEVVMEDSREELRKHLPIWLNAKGSVLVTGLGLGCVVRGLLASPNVTQITVVEIDRSILRVIGHEFESNKRVELIESDALKIQFGKRMFDYAWHDLWTDGDEHLQVQHARLLVRFRKNCAVQGAWAFPREHKRSFAENMPIIG